MQKKIRQLAIIATALVGASLFLLVATLPFQRGIASLIYGYYDDLLSELPFFPLVPFLVQSLRAGCIALLIVCCGNKKGGIWLEILVIVLLAIVLPLISFFANLGYNIYLGYLGHAKTAMYSMVSTISNFLCCPAGLGGVLAYIVCGMSIAYKTICKSQNLEQ